MAIRLNIRALSKNEQARTMVDWWLMVRDMRFVLDLLENNRFPLDGYRLKSCPPNFPQNVFSEYWKMQVQQEKPQ